MTEKEMLDLIEKLKKEIAEKDQTIEKQADYIKTIDNRITVLNAELIALNNSIHGLLNEVG